jgi:hypothetical protein
VKLFMFAAVTAALLFPAGARALSVTRAGPVIRADERHVAALLADYPHGWKRLVQALNHEASDLRSVRARGDVERGLTLVADAYGRLAVAVRRAHGGAVPRSEVRRIVAEDKRGRALLLHGHAAGWRGNRHG